MKHVLKFLVSLDPRERIWERYKRFRQAAWSVRKGMKEEKRIFAKDGEVLRNLSFGSGSISPVLLDATKRRADTAGQIIAKESQTYEWLSNTAERLRFLYFLLHGRICPA
jgi:hypothetical protein